METPTPTPPPVLTPAQEAEARLYVLAVNFRHAKEAEETAKANRIAIEEMIAALIPGPETGQKTVTVKDGSKLVVTRGFNYKADIEAIKHYQLAFGAPITSKTTHALDVKGYEWYRENHPDVFAQIAQHVSVTPKKVSVALKPAKEE